MFCTLSEKEEATAVAFSFSLSSNHSYPGWLSMATLALKYPRRMICLSGLLQKLQNPDHHRTFVSPYLSSTWSL